MEARAEELIRLIRIKKPDFEKVEVKDPEEEAREKRRIQHEQEAKTRAKTTKMPFDVVEMTVDSVVQLDENMQRMINCGTCAEWSCCI